MKTYFTLIFLTVFILVSKQNYAQYNSPFDQKEIDFKIIRDGKNYISPDSFFNKRLTKFDSFDIDSCIATSHFYPLYRKGYLIIKVDSILGISLVSIAGNLMDYMQKTIKDEFLNSRIQFREDLLEDAKGKYIIMPLIVFATDKKSGAIDSRITKVVKHPYIDSGKVAAFFEAMTVSYLPDFFVSTPVTKKGWLNAIWLPLVYVNYGSNKYYYGSWYKTLE